MVKSLALCQSPLLHLSKQAAKQARPLASWTVIVMAVKRARPLAVCRRSQLLLRLRTSAVFCHASKPPCSRPKSEPRHVNVARFSQHCRPKPRRASDPCPYERAQGTIPFVGLHKWPAMLPTTQGQRPSPTVW